jgi:hypothetical protein
VIWPLFCVAEYVYVADLSDAETLRVMDLLEQDFRSARLTAKIPDGRAEVVENDVVPEDDTDTVAIGERFGQRKRVRNSAFPFLVGVVQAHCAEIPAVSEQSC